MERRLSALAAEPPVAAARAAVPDAEGVWVVGGALRDALLGRAVTDLDLAVAGDAAAVARAVARVAGGHAFQLSERFGAWRAIGDGGAWLCDVTPLQGRDLESDLASRDFTVNAMAMPLAGGELVDPFGGARDLEARVLRVLDGAYDRDPLRPLRLARLHAELGLSPERETERLTRAAAPRVVQAAAERVYAELRRLLLADGVLHGLALAERTGLLRAVLPEVAALQGVAQSQFHHLDVYAHTVEVLRCEIELEGGRLEEVFGELAPGLRTVLDEPLGDELTRFEALRLGALLHDIGKPATRRLTESGRVTFIGHDAVGERMVRQICRRLRTSERVRELVAGVTRHHLVLGFLVHERPLSRALVYRYLKACSPVEVEVTVLSCADRLATRGKNAEPAIAAHLELARELMEAALEWRARGPPSPPVRGDELARELGIRKGPELGRLLAALEEAVYIGELATRTEAIEYARRLRDNSAAP